MFTEATARNRLRDGFQAVCPSGLMVCLEGSSGQAKGLPDRLFLAGGLSTWIEVKVKEAGRISALQWVQLRRLVAAGQRAWVAWCWPDRAVLHRIQPQQQALGVGDAHPWEHAKQERFWTTLLGGKL